MAYIYPIYHIVSITSIIMFMLRYSEWHIFITSIASYLSHLSLCLCYVIAYGIYLSHVSHRIYHIVSLCLCYVITYGIYLSIIMFMLRYSEWHIFITSIASYHYVYVTL